MKTKRTLKNLAALLLLVGIFSTCTSEDIAVIQIEDNAELATRQHIDMSELYNYHVRGFSVELRLKPQALNRNSSYSIATDVEVKTLSLRYNATLRQSFLDTTDPVLQQFYTLTILENYTSIESRSNEGNRERRESVIERVFSHRLI